MTAPLALIQLAEALPGWEVFLQVSAPDPGTLVPPQMQVRLRDARTTRARYTIWGAWCDDLALAVESVIEGLLRSSHRLTRGEERALKILVGRQL